MGEYAHADVLFHQTGLGEAIWHPSGGYSPDIMAAAGPTLTVSHWSTLSQLTNPEFYSTMLQRAWTLHLTPIGAIVMIAGLAMFWIPNRLVVDVWFATVLLFILATAEGNYYHEFHQLPMLLPAALYFGFAARPAFDGTWLRRVMPCGHRHRRVGRGARRGGFLGSPAKSSRPGAVSGPMPSIAGRSSPAGSCERDPDRCLGHHRGIRPLRRQLADSAVSRPASLAGASTRRRSRRR